MTVALKPIKPIKQARNNRKQAQRRALQSTAARQQLERKQPS